ncbi:uncharacterized protein LOC133326991 [Musca vetustissima]|uniref:uncharacterized protein LOC133326991 n=1 Tax=Musca vetustissima TaxID=27455 RepID=UPI002AB780F4|nr:uncharacterized protein LOC133326991 [Musca vetustissima]
MSNEIDAKRLIHEVRVRPALWDLNHEDNKSYNEIGRQWKEVAGVLGVEDVEQCRRKWKNLRDSYRALVKRCEQRKARDLRMGISDPNIDYESKWVYFKDLSFIRDKKRKRRSRIEIEQDQNTNSTDDFEESHAISEIKVEPTRIGDDEIYSIEEFEDDDCVMDGDMADVEFEDIQKQNNDYHRSMLNEQHLQRIPATISVISVPHSEATKITNNIPKASLKPRMSSLSSDATKSVNNLTMTSLATPRLTLPVPPTIKVAIIPKENSSATPNDSANKKDDCHCSSRSENNVHFLENLEQEENNLMQSTREDMKRATTDHNGDPDYNFLVSFLPQMKKMNDLQNLQFRARMSDLVLNILVPPMPNTVPPPLTAAPTSVGNAFQTSVDRQQHNQPPYKVTL